MNKEPEGFEKKCPICEGDGEIQGEMDYDNNDIPVWNLEKCPKCNGTGKLVTHTVQV